MKPSITFLLPAALFLLFSCKYEVKQPAAPAASSPEPTEKSAIAGKPEVEIYTAFVNGLRMRETPDATGKVVAQFPKGSVLTARGKRSDKKVTMPLGLSDETDYFYEVAAADGKTGWIFGPALTKVFAGAKPGAPGADFEKFALELGKLPTNKVESGGKAYKLLQSMLPKGGDPAFVLMERLLHSINFDPVIAGSLEKPGILKKLESEGEKIWGGSFDPQKYLETKILADNGFRIETTEGSYFPTVDFQQLKTAFANDGIRPPTAAWLDQTIVESLNPTSSDGGLAIELNELVQRAIFWENWVKNNRYHVFADHATESAKWLAADVLIGMNNTPVFDYEKNTVSAEAQKSWEQVLKEYPKSDLAADITEITALIKADGGKRGPKTEEFVKKLIGE